MEVFSLQAGHSSPQCVCLAQGCVPDQKSWVSHYNLGAYNFGLVCPRSKLGIPVESTVPFKLVWSSAFPHSRKTLVLRSRNCVSPRELKNFDFQSPISGGVPASYLTGMPSLALCEIMMTRTLMSRAAQISFAEVRVRCDTSPTLYLASYC